MEKCKFCFTQLEEGSTLCPGCGKDNAEEEAVVAVDAETANIETTAGESETAGVELPEKPRMNPGKLAIAIAAMVVLVAVLAGLVISGMDRSALPQQMGGQENVQAGETGLPSDSAAAMEATVPADGNADDETCKGSYSATDDEVIAARDTVIATAGGHELTLGELQIYYWQEVGSWLNQYGSYAIYFGLDATRPLDTQSCQLLEGRTWQQYFLLRALNSWQTYLAMDVAAEEADFQLGQEYADVLSKLPENMEEEAVSAGFESAEALMAYNVGVGCDVEDYVRFMEVYYRGYSFYLDYCDSVTATDEEVQAMFLAHQEEYAANGLTEDTKSVNVRHILVYPEGATSETVRTETFPEEAWAAGKAAAEAILAQWDGTEEGFAALAGEHSQDPGSVGNGGLYTGVNQGDMVANFDAWCFDPERKVGDSGIVETEFGYHIMYYSGETLQWPILVKEDVINEKINNFVDAAIEQVPISVDYSKILLSLAGAFAPAQ